VLQKVEKLFGEYDANHNGSLDEEELAAMNLEQFFKIPRLGIADISKFSCCDQAWHC
jgi:Ca2+-binding EF-hand superfamily protein